MPTIIEALPRSTGGATIYDWKTMLDGQPRRYLRGEDYTSTDSSFRTYVYQKARKEGKFVSIRSACDADGNQIGWDLQSREEVVQ
jgi:hypothetical protein